MYTHHVNANANWYAALNDTPGRAGPPSSSHPPISVNTGATHWTRTVIRFWPFGENVRSWWTIRHLPNVLIVDFNDLKLDMQGEMRRIARFLDIAIDESRWDDIVTYSSFDWMKLNATVAVSLGGAFWDGAADRVDPCATGCAPRGCARTSSRNAGCRLRR